MHDSTKRNEAPKVVLVLSGLLLLFGGEVKRLGWITDYSSPSNRLHR